MPNRPRSTAHITQLLVAWSGGRREALDDLLPLVYDELRRLASRYLRHEPVDHTLQPTALVHEAYMRLIDQRKVQWRNRAHFYGVAAQIMRRVLVDHARAHNYQKRGGGARPLSLDEAVVASPDRAPDLLALDEALERLTKQDPRKGKVVELRFFGGLSVEETAAVLNVSPFTVIRDWNFVKAWLSREIKAAVY